MIEKVGAILTEAVQAVLPMLLPKSVDVSMEGVSEWRPESFQDPMVLITTDFSEGPAGSVYLLTRTSDASRLVDMMLGGEGSPDRQMEGESVDALKEMMNQVFGVVASSLREKFNGPFGFVQVEIHSLDAEMDLGLLLDDSITSRIEVKVTPEGSEAFAVYGCFPESTLTSFEQEAQDNAAKPSGRKGAEGGSAQANTAEEPASQPKSEPPAKKAAAPRREIRLAAESQTNIDLILDIELPVIIRLGNTEMTLKEIMRLGPGAVIELDKAVEEPVEMLVNNQIIARGEVVVVEGNFAFRVTDIESKRERLESLT